MSTPLVVVGGTMAALAAADAAASAGREVELLLPRRGVGGGFAPLPAGGHRLDRGLRALELHYEGAAAVVPPLLDYDAAGAGHRSHVARLRAYVEGLVGDALVELDRPRMWWRGRLGDELLVTCDLTDLRGYLTAAEAEVVARQARGTAAGLLHPRHAEALRRTPLDVASREQHGAWFHEQLLAPLAAKLRPEGAGDVPADLRRKLWLPLFHPRTLRQAAAGGALGFRPERPLHTIAPGGTGRLVDALLARVEASPRVRVRGIDGVARIAHGAGGGVAVTPTDGPPVHAEDPILALAAGDLFAAAGIDYAPERVRSVLAWVTVAAADVRALPAFVHVVDPDVPVFRLSRGETVDGRVVVCAELAHDVAAEDAPDVAAAALRRLGLVRPDAPVAAITAFAGPTFTAPTFANAARFAAARAAYDARGLPAQAIGGVEAFGADSLNEQLLQGLRAAALASPAQVAPAAAA